MPLAQCGLDVSTRRLQPRPEIPRPSLRLRRKIDFDAIAWDFDNVRDYNACPPTVQATSMPKDIFEATTASSKKAPLGVATHAMVASA